MIHVESETERSIIIEWRSWLCITKMLSQDYLIFSIAYVQYLNKNWPNFINKTAKCVFSWPAHFKNGQLFRNWPSNSQSGKPGYSNPVSSVWNVN